MNEQPLIQALLKTVQQVADAHGATRVISIHVRIGESSQVEPELLSNTYSKLVQDTPLKDTVLTVQRAHLEAACNQCGNRFPIEHGHFECDKCGSMRVSLRGDEELLLESVTLEEQAPVC